MQPSPSAIPGVSRTLAEESLDPGIASLERSVRQRSAAGAEFDTVRRLNNDARVKAIQGFAGDEAAISAAEQARSAATTPLLNQALAAPLPPGQVALRQALGLRSKPRIDLSSVRAVVGSAIDRNTARPTV